MWIIVNIHIHHLWLSQTCGFLKSRQVGRRCQLQSPGRVRRRYEEHFPSTPRTTNWNEWSQIHCLVDLPKTSRDSRCGQIFHQLPADIRRWFKMDAWGWKDWKQVGWPVLQIEGEHLPPRKKKQKHKLPKLTAPQAHGDQNPKDPNDKKQQDANPEECFQGFCHCSNDNPKFSKFLLKKLQQFVFETSSSGGVTSQWFPKDFLVQLKEEFFVILFFFIKCLLKKNNFTWNNNGSHQNPSHRWTRELNQEDTHGTKQLNQQNPKI